MFKDEKELENFMIFCHTHYELNDVWRFKNGDKGINFSGYTDNETGCQKYNPYKLPENERPETDYKKRTQLSEMYKVWNAVKNNLTKY